MLITLGLRRQFAKSRYNQHEIRILWTRKHMTKLINSHSLTDFQRNARSYIESINETHEPLLLTVNGKVQAVVVDPETFQ
jgi:prevent-host-death family protein